MKKKIAGITLFVVLILGVLGLGLYSAKETLTENNTSTCATEDSNDGLTSIIDEDVALSDAPNLEPASEKESRDVESILYIVIGFGGSALIFLGYSAISKRK